MKEVKNDIRNRCAAMAKHEMYNKVSVLCENHITSDCIDGIGLAMKIVNRSISRLDLSRIENFRKFATISRTFPSQEFFYCESIVSIR